MCILMTVIFVILIFFKLIFESKIANGRLINYLAILSYMIIISLTINMYN